MNRDGNGGIWDHGAEEEEDDWHPLLEWEPPENTSSSNPNSSGPPSQSTSSLMYNNWHNPDLTLFPPIHPRERVVVGRDGTLPEQEPGESENSPSPGSATPPPNLHGLAVWFPSWDEEDALQRLEQNLDSIHEVHFLWYNLGPDGTITAVSEERETTEKALSLAREKGVQVIPAIGNRFSAGLTREILQNEEKRDRLTRQISTLVQARGYDGIDILFQPMEETEREAFAGWIESLATILHQKEKVLHVTVHPQTGRGTSHSVQRSQDWRRIGQAADRVKIMAFNYSWDHPGPSTPLDWLDEVILHATEEIEPSKVTIALSTVGWIWPEGQAEAQRTFSYSSVAKLSENQRLQPNRDENGELHLKIEEKGERYHAWYPDGESVLVKWRWIKEHHPDIGGLALWYLGSEDPDLWSGHFDLTTE